MLSHPSPVSSSNCPKPEKEVKRWVSGCAEIKIVGHPPKAAAQSKGPALAPSIENMEPSEALHRSESELIDPCLVHIERSKRGEAPQRFEVIDLCLGQIERLERGKALQRFEVIDICPRQIEITDRRQPG